jgi:hypothetical protein
MTLRSNRAAALSVVVFVAVLTTSQVALATPDPLVEGPTVEAGVTDGPPPAAVDRVPDPDFGAGATGDRAAADGSDAVASAANAEFEIQTSRSKFRVVHGESWEVSMTVRNTGDEAASKELTYDVGSIHRETDMYLTPGEEDTWSVTVDSSNLDTGTYTEYFETPDDQHTMDVDIEPEYEHFLVGNLRAENAAGESVQRVSQGEVIDIEAVIYNDADGYGSQHPDCYVDSTHVGGEFMTLDPGEDEDISCEVDTSEYDTGYHDFGVESENDSWYKEIYITEPPQPPEITSASPGSNVVLDRGEDERVELDVSVDDPDTNDNSLSYEWRVDGREVSSQSFLELYASELDPGERTVTVTVDDDQPETDSATHEWTVDVVAPPTLTATTPESQRFELGPNETTDLSVEATDPDTSASDLDVVWRVNGDRAASGSSFEFEAAEYGSGEHDVSVVVSDGEPETADVGYEWTATVLEPPEIYDAGPERTTAKPGVPVHFSADVGDPSGYEITSVEWDVAGQTVSGRSFEHVFDEVGTKKVTLTVRNERGLEATESFEVEVTPTPPSLSDAGPGQSTVAIGEPLQLSASATDPRGRDVTFDYEWVVDGERSYDRRTQTVRFDSVGEHEIELTVANEYGAEATREFTVDVRNDKPEVSRQSPDSEDYSVVSQTPVRFGAVVSNRDAGSAEVTMRVDGDTVDRRTMRGDEQTFSLRHAFPKPGESTVTFVARDSHGAKTELSWDVDVRSQPPTFDSLSPDAQVVRLESGATAAFDASATDPEGEGVSYEWTLDGDAIGTGRDVSHVFNRSGRYNVTVEAVDPQGSASTRSWDVRVRSFETAPEQNVHLSDVEIDPEANTSTATFLSMSLENPASNDRTVVVEFVVQTPDGLVPIRLNDVSEASQAQITGIGRVEPGQQKSMRIGLELADESLAGERLSFGVTIRYYPENNPADVTLLQDANASVNVVGSGLTVESPGFTPAGAVAALAVFALVVSALARREA